MAPPLLAASRADRDAGSWFPSEGRSHARRAQRSCRTHTYRRRHDTARAIRRNRRWWHCWGHRHHSRLQSRKPLIAVTFAQLHRPRPHAGRGFCVATVPDAAGSCLRTSCDVRAWLMADCAKLSSLSHRITWGTLARQDIACRAVRAGQRLATQGLLATAAGP